MDDLPVSAALFTVRKDRDAFEDWKKKKNYTQIKLYSNVNNMKSKVIWPSSLILVSYWDGNLIFNLFLNKVSNHFHSRQGPGSSLPL